MTNNKFSEFLKEVGHQVIEAGGGLWYDIYPRYYHIFMNFPDHIPIDPSLKDVDKLLGMKGFAVRYTCHPSHGRKSYHYSCSDRNYDVERLSPNVRSKVRRGLKRCVVRRLSFLELLKYNALDINDETLIRQGRRISAYNRRYLTRYYRTAGHFEIAEAWGAFAGKELAAYLVAFNIDDCAKIMHVRSDRELLRHYPNNALIYEYTKHALSTDNVTEVSFGLEPIQSELSSLGEFKMGMGYFKKPIGQMIVVNRYIRALVQNSYFEKIIEMIGNACSEESFKKLQGMLRICGELKKAKVL